MTRPVVLVLVVLLGVLLGACSTPARSEGTATPRHAAEPVGPVSLIVFVRHAEKAGDGTNDPPLTSAGEERAACLARALAPLQPDHLLTSEYRRTRATLQPLAEAIGIEPRPPVAAKELDAWTKTLLELPPGARAVVAGHSNTIPAWAAALGVALPGLDADGNIPHDDYDRMIFVVRDADGRALTSYTTAYCTSP